MKKAKFILLVTLVLSGGLAGCSTFPDRTDTKIFDYSNGDSPAVEGIVITDLGSGFSVRAAADSWPALVLKVKPTFAWNGCDLMWIESNLRGEPRFVLDEAYLYQPTNQARQWVLLKTGIPNVSDKDLRQAEPGFFYSNFNLRTETTPGDRSPGGDFGFSFAKVASANPEFGTVYEINWQREMGVGTGHPDYGRHIYVFRGRSNQWHFLGEGPDTGRGKSGGNEGASSDFDLRVMWNATRANELPIQLHFVEKEEWDEWITEDNTNFIPRESLVYYSESILAGDFPAKLQSTTKHPYLIAEQGDTFDKIAGRCAAWWPGKDVDESLKAKTAIMWQTGLAWLNPRLPPAGNIQEGTRIQILTYAESVDRLTVLEKADSK